MHVPAFYTRLYPDTHLIGEADSQLALYRDAPGHLGGTSITQVMPLVMGTLVLGYPFPRGYIPKSNLDTILESILSISF